MIPIGAFGFRAGSLPDRLLVWARARRKPFMTRDVREALGINDWHARMLLRRTRAHLRRVGRGRYVEVLVYARATAASRKRWRLAARQPAPFRPGSRIERFARWIADRKTPFGIRDASRAAGGNTDLATRMLMRTVARGLAERVGRGTYVGSGVPRSTIAAWRARRRRRPFRAGSGIDRFVVWSGGRKTRFGASDAARAVGVGYAQALKMIRASMARGLVAQAWRGVYLPAVPPAPRRARR